MILAGVAFRIAKRSATPTLWQPTMPISEDSLPIYGPRLGHRWSSRDARPAEVEQDTSLARLANGWETEKLKVDRFAAIRLGVIERHCQVRTLDGLGAVELRTLAPFDAPAAGACRYRVEEQGGIGKEARGSSHDMTT